jgi:hypothetical protein
MHAYGRKRAQHGTISIALIKERGNAAALSEAGLIS